MISRNETGLVLGVRGEKEEDFIPMYVKSISSKHYSFYLSESVVFDVGYYSPLLEVLKHANEGDVIDIHISSWGGSVDVAVQIINNISTTKAEVNTYLESIAHSAGSMIFLAGHNHFLGMNCSMLIHNYSGYLGGKGYELVKHSQHLTKRMERLLRGYYKGFLTEEEIEKVLHDQDIWLEDDEIETRLKNFYETRLRDASEDEDEEETSEGEDTEATGQVEETSELDN